MLAYDMEGCSLVAHQSQRLIVAADDIEAWIESEHQGTKNKQSTVHLIDLIVAEPLMRLDVPALRS